MDFLLSICKEMILHALYTLKNELEKHFADSSGLSVWPPQVCIGNIAGGIGKEKGMVPGDQLCLTLIRINVDSHWKNLSPFAKDADIHNNELTKVPFNLNFHLLVTATHYDYNQAILFLSETIDYFQENPIFKVNTADQIPFLKDFYPAKSQKQEPFTLKLVWENISLDEASNLWLTLGGKMYPHALYLMNCLQQGKHERLKSG